MKFVDPLITLWHMGGAMPTHIGMAIYSSYIFYQIQNVTQKSHNIYDIAQTGTSIANPNK